MKAIRPMAKETGKASFSIKKEATMRETGLIIAWMAKESSTTLTAKLPTMVNGKMMSFAEKESSIMTNQSQLRVLSITRISVPSKTSGFVTRVI
jgi:hypothetical protein